MFTLLMGLALASPQPAQFEVAIDTNTEVTVFMGNLKVKPGTVYQITPFTGTMTVQMTVKYIDGDEVITQTGVVTFEAGRYKKILLKVFARPPTIVLV